MILLHLFLFPEGTFISNSPRNVFEVDDSAHELDAVNWDGRVRYRTPYAGTWSVKVGVGDGWAMKDGVKSRRTDIVLSGSWWIRWATCED